MQSYPDGFGRHGIRSWIVTSQWIPNWAGLESIAQLPVFYIDDLFGDYCFLVYIFYKTISCNELYLHTYGSII